MVDRWYDGYRIVISDVLATYGHGRLPAPPGASQIADDTPDHAAVSGGDATTGSEDPT